jgi:hypothetical protein
MRPGSNGSKSSVLNPDLDTLEAVDTIMTSRVDFALLALLLLPIGLIVVLVLFYLLMFGGVSFFPGEFLLLLVIVVIAVAVARMLYWRARRRSSLTNWTRF